MAELTLNSRRYPGLVALVDDEDYGTIRAAGRLRPQVRPSGQVYVRLRLDDGRDVYLHNFICQLHGLPKSPDHINRNGLDNRKENFRPANGTQQQGNKGLQSNNTSGFRGVTLDRGRDKWLAYLTEKVDGVRHFHNLGRFDSPEDAARARDKFAVEHFGAEYAYLNFPDEWEVNHAGASRAA